LQKRPIILRILLIVATPWYSPSRILQAHSPSPRPLSLTLLTLTLAYYPSIAYSLPSNVYSLPDYAYSIAYSLVPLADSCPLSFSIFSRLPSPFSCFLSLTLSSSLHLLLSLLLPTLSLTLSLLWLTLLSLAYSPSLPSIAYALPSLAYALPPLAYSPFSRLLFLSPDMQGVHFELNHDGNSVDRAEIDHMRFNHSHYFLLLDRLQVYLNIYANSYTQNIKNIKHFGRNRSHALQALTLLPPS